MKRSDFDALIVGCGFGGIYQLKRLRDLGLSCIAIDAAGDVGGVWYWNRYPGAMSDTESYIYRYSWDKEDLVQYPWKDRYVKQPEVLAYLNHVTDKYDLRRSMQFNTEFTEMNFNEQSERWTITCKSGEVLTAKFVVTALGLLSKQNYPDIMGRQSFKGEMYHSGSFPEGVSFDKKRVGVIGSGSTGIQIITAIAKQNSMKELLSFQRSPQWSVPSGDGPVSKEHRESVNGRYDAIWDQVFNSIVAFGFKESTTKTTEVSPEERERIYEEAWKTGNGFRFMYSTFCDITLDEEANETARAFMRKKIMETVKDPEKSRKLILRDLYARRPLCDSGYYEQFNRPNVDVIDIKTTPIIEITPTGIKTSEGKLYELDMIIFATGFDAVEGNYNRCNIVGRTGQNLKDYWNKRVTSLFGVAVPKFPNLFLITGPNSPFTNNPPAIEVHVDFISKAIEKAVKDKAPVIEATVEAEEWWTRLCEEACQGSLFKKTQSWIFGSNIAGKPDSIRFYFHGMKDYRGRLQECIDAGYKGFKPF